MKIFPSALLSRCALAFAFALPALTAGARPLVIGGNDANHSYAPMTGVQYLEMRSTLSSEFPGTTYSTITSFTGNLSGFDLLVLNRFDSADLLPAEQTNIRNYVLNGGNLLYVGEASGYVNDSFTQPFGITMQPDPATVISLALASYTNSVSAFLNGPFGKPPNPASGSDAAKITTLGLSAELARWTGGGVAISGFGRHVFGPNAGFGLFVTDLNMMTPGRYSNEFGSVLANALAIPEPGSGACLLAGASLFVGCFRFARGSRGRARRG